MSSSVFFRFKSQKEPSRVTFDGTGISVFELKREIITQSKLGDGTDFELIISSEETNEAFDDDTSIIPRSTTVIAKRMPATRSGRGGAARYVQGKMPQHAKQSHRQEVTNRSTAAGSTKAPSATADTTQTEDQKIAQMLQLGANDWAQQQQQMASVVPVNRSGPSKSKPNVASDRPLPQAYVCNRCGEKGHWIWDCPTNNDPAFDGRPRIKRTTGIPRSFLKTIEKPASLQNDGLSEEKKQPTGVMVNSEGEWVVAEPDQATWDRYQAQTKTSLAAQNAAAEGNKELQDLGLECKIDKRLFVDPRKTPCCGTTFCHECIQNALLDNDLRCPQCSTDNVPIDDLTLDTEAAEKVRLYREKKIITGPQDQENESTKFPTIQPFEGSIYADSPSSPTKLAEKSESVSGAARPTSKKRPAESDLVNDRRPQGPGNSSVPEQRSKGEHSIPEASHPSKANNQHTDRSRPGHTAMNNLNGMNDFSGMDNMNNLMGMNMGMPLSNPPMLPMGPFSGAPWMNMWQMGLQSQGLEMGQPSLGNSSLQNPFALYNQPQPNLLANSGYQTAFANQQRSANEEESAYFRKPVNTSRQGNRRNWNQSRPADYREV